MVNKYIYFLGLAASGKSTYLNEHYPDAFHFANVCVSYNIKRMWDLTQYDFAPGKKTNNKLKLSLDSTRYEIMKYISSCLTFESHKYNKATVIISADEIKTKLDGYTPEHPELVHEQSVQIAKWLIYAIADCKDAECDIILDGGGINNHYNISIIEELRKRNVKNITCVFFDTPIEVCLKRLEKRERKVPVEDVYRKNLMLEVCKNRYINLVDEFIRVDYFTNKYLLLDMDGTLACYGKAKLDIHGNSDFVSSELFKNLKPVNHVIEFIKTHYKDNMQNVYIITACANSIAWKEKNEWLDRYFPEIPVDNRMFVGNKNYKHVFIEQFAHKMKWKINDVTIIDDFHDTLTKCTGIGINAIHPSNITAMFDKYSYQA